jgi:hypothetical protein
MKSKSSVHICACVMLILLRVASLDSVTEQNEGLSAELYQIQDKLKVLRRAINLRLSALKDRLSVLNHRETSVQVQKNIDLYYGIKNRKSAIKDKISDLEDRLQTLNFNFSDQIDQYKIDQFKAISYQADVETESEKKEIESLLAEDPSVSLPLPEDQNYDLARGPSLDTGLGTNEKSGKTSIDLLKSVPGNSTEGNQNSKNNDKTPFTNPNANNTRIDDLSADVKKRNSTDQSIASEIQADLLMPTKDIDSDFQEDSHGNKTDSFKIADSQALDDYNKDLLQDKSEEQKALYEIEKERQNVLKLQTEVNDKLRYYSSNIEDFRKSFESEGQENVSISTPSILGPVSVAESQQNSEAPMTEEDTQTQDMYKKRSKIFLEIAGLNSRIDAKKSEKSLLFNKLKEIEDLIQSRYSDYVLGDFKDHSSNKIGNSPISHRQADDNDRLDADIEIMIKTDSENMTEVSKSINQISDEMDSLEKEIKALSLFKSEKDLESRILDADIEESELKSLYSSKSKLSLENIALETQRREKVYNEIQKLEKKRQEIVDKERQQMGAIQSKDIILAEQDLINKQKLQESLLSSDNKEKPVRADLFNVFGISVPKDFAQIEENYDKYRFSTSRRLYFSDFPKRNSILKIILSFATSKNSTDPERALGRKLLRLMTQMLDLNVRGPSIESCHTNSNRVKELSCRALKRNPTYRQFIFNMNKKIQDFPNRLLQETKKLLVIPKEVRVQISKDLNSIPECIQNINVEQFTNGIINKIEMEVLKLKNEGHSSSLMKILEMFRNFIAQSQNVNSDNYKEFIGAEIMIFRSLLNDLASKETFVHLKDDLIYILGICEDLQSKLKTRYKFSGLIKDDADLFLGMINSKISDALNQDLNLTGLTDQDIQTLKQRIIARIESEVVDSDASTVSELIQKVGSAFDIMAVEKIGKEYKEFISKEFVSKILNDILKKLEKLKDPLKQSNFIYNTADLEDVTGEIIDNLHTKTSSEMHNQLKAIDGILIELRNYFKDVKITKFEAERLSLSVYDEFESWFQSFIVNFENSIQNSEESSSAKSMINYFKNAIDEYSRLSQNFIVLSDKLNIRSYIDKFLESRLDDTENTNRVLCEISHAYAQKRRMNSTSRTLFSLAFALLNNATIQGPQATSRYIDLLMKRILYQNERMESSGSERGVALFGIDVLLPPAFVLKKKAPVRNSN